MAQDELDQGESGGGGLVVNAPLMLGMVWSALCADVIADMEYATRPYEVKPGQTDAVVKDSIGFMYDVFRNRPNHREKFGAIAWQLATKLLHQGAPRGLQEMECDRS